MDEANEMNQELKISWPRDAGSEPKLANQTALAASGAQPGADPSGIILTLGYAMPPIIVSQEDLSRFLEETGGEQLVVVHSSSYLPRETAEELWTNLGNVLGKNA